MDGNCLVSCIVYKAEVTTNQTKKIYYGSCSSTFKDRYNNHTSSFRHKSKKEETKLSQYVWELKNQNQQFEIAWSIEKKCSPYRPSSNKCDLCTTEKLVIIKERNKNMLNKRSEIANKCRHSNKFILYNILKNRLKF